MPPSTATGWLSRAPLEVVAASSEGQTFLAFHRRIARLELRLRRLSAALRLLLVRFRVRKPHLFRVRFAGLDKARLLRAVGAPTSTP